MSDNRRKPITPSFDYEEIVRNVAQAQIATQHIPAIVAQEIKKSWKQVPNVDPERSPKSWFHDPLSLQYSLGYKDRRFSITYETLKRIAGQLSIISAIINTRAAQVATFAQPYRWTKSLGFTIRHKDPDHPTTPSEIAFIKELEDFIMRCGRSERNPYSRVPRDDFENFLRKVVRDSLIYDQCCAEIVPDRLGIPYEFLAVDAASIRVASDNRYIGVNQSYHQRYGFVPDMPSRFANLYEGREYGVSESLQGNPIAYVQVINGQIENVYSHDELMFGVRNPRTDVYCFPYGYGELEQLITIVTSHLYAEMYNQKFFSQGTSPKGLLNLKGDNYTPEMLEGFRRQWLAQAAGVENSWRTPIFQSEGIEWVDLAKTNAEMEFGKWIEYLIKIACHTASSPVLTDKGEKPISEIKSGDLVFSHTGTLKKVLNTQVSAYKGDLLLINIGGKTTEVTPEHPYLVAHPRKDKDRRKSVVDAPIWQKAEKLKVGDCLCVPKKTYINEGNTTLIDLYSYVSNAKLSDDGLRIAPNAHRISWISRYLPLNESTAFALGLYVSEGNCTNYGAFFTLDASENDLVERIVELAQILNIPPSVYKAKSTTNNVCLHSRVLCEAFSKLFGSNAGEKRIPIELMNAPPSIRKAFLSGVIARDGSVPNFTIGSVVLTISSVSEILISQLRTMFLYEDVWSQEYTYKAVCGFLGKKQYRLDINGIQSKKVSLWLQGIKGDRLRNRVAVSKQLKSCICENDEFFFVPIRKISRKSFIGKVYNFEVEDDHTYQIRRFATHNCGVYLIDPAEINFDMHGGQQQTPLFESSQEWKIKASRDRGLKPLLRFLAKLINRHIIDKIDDHFAFEFVGLDELSESEKHEMLVEQISSYLTLNEARRSLDLPDLPGGDVPMNPVYLNALQQQQQGQQGQPGQEGGNPSPEGKPSLEGKPTSPSPQYSDNFKFDNQKSDVSSTMTKGV